MKIEDKLFNTLAGFLSMNQYIDSHIKTNDALLKSRSANYGLIRTAIIASEFITSTGMEKRYKEYEKKVNKKLADKVAKNAKEI